MRSFYLLLVGSLLLGASNAEVACTVDDLYSLFNLGETGTDLLPATGICSSHRPLPVAVRQDLNQVGRNLVFNQISNNLSAPFCLGLAITANTEGEEPLFYIYDGSPTPVGSLQINSANITFTLNGQEAFFERNFVANFDQFQLCSNGTFMNLYLNCSLVASTAFSTTGVSEFAVISLFTPLLQISPRFGGALQQLYISSCSAATGIPAQTQVSAQCTSLPACQLPFQTIAEVFQQLATTPEDLFSGYSCSCPIGFSGTNCDQEEEFGFFCNHEITQTNTGNYTWEETEDNNMVLQGCALGPAQGIAVGDAVARRKCNMFGEWENPDTDNCITIVSRQFMVLQESIITEEITGENIEQITGDLREIVRAAREEVDQTQENLAVVVNVFVRTAAAVSERQTVVVVDEQTVNNIVEIVDDLMVWPEAVLEQNSSRIIQSFETIAINLVQQENFTDVTIIEEDVVFVAARVPVQRLQTSGASFTSSRSVNAPLNVDTDERVEVGLLPREAAAAILPATIFNQIRNLEQEAIGVFFLLYEESSLFPIADPPSNTRIGSPVVAATVAGRTVRDLPEPVIVLVRLNDITDGNITARRCVSWNFTLAGGRGNWTTEGCQTLETDDNDVIMCDCNHLTNFASLVDICTRTDGCVIPPGVELALDIISIIGVVLSLIGVVLTVITLLASKKLRERDVTKFHIQLCIALFCVLIVFVIGIDKTKLYSGCVTVSALIQYFILVAVMWMGAEAVLMFQKVVIVFVHITTRYIIAVSFICWLVPIVPVVIPLAIDCDYMLTFDVMTSSPRFCFIGNTGVFFGAFLGPIFAILVFNAVIFVIVVVVLLRHSMNRRRRTKEQMSTAKAIHLLISIMGVMVLFGLTWVLAALTISEASLVFQIPFAAFNSLQGFFLFLFFCVFSEDARNFWRQVFSCGHYKSGSSSYPLHPKVASSAVSTSKLGGLCTLSTALEHSTLGASGAGEHHSSEVDTPLPFANPVAAEKEFPITNSPTSEQVSSEGQKRTP